MNPLSDFFYKIKRRGGSPTSAPRVKFYHRGFRKVVLGPPISSKYRLFGINLPLRVFLQSLAWGGSSKFASSRHLQFCSFINVGLQPQNRQNGNFWCKFVRKGNIPLSDFTKFDLRVCTLMPNFTAVTLKMSVCSPLNRQNWYFLQYGEGSPGSHPYAKLYCCGFKNLGLRPPKSQKNGNC